MLITICGGGNAAHTLTGLLASREDLSVRVYVPYGDEAERWQQGVRRGGGVTGGGPRRARGGFDRGARAVLAACAAQVPLFGLQTLPWACRIQHYGRQAGGVGGQEQGGIAASPPAPAPL